jgi:transketolase
VALSFNGFHFSTEDSERRDLMGKGGLRSKRGGVSPESMDELCINTIRILSVDAVEKANSGHPGLPMGAAAAAYVLWDKFLRHNPSNPHWPGRDRFILSAGHGSMLLYALLYLTGYNLPLMEIKRFRQWKSMTPGHPEYGRPPGVEMTTGLLGQGFATGVGMAIAAEYLANYFNRRGFNLFTHNIYAIVSDGDLMEGLSYEAASLAGHLNLGRIVYIYLDNKISIEGSTEMTFTEDIRSRFEAQNWHVQKVDGYQLEEIANAIEQAKGERNKPSLIIARTHIGYGSPNKQDSADAHGAPLGKEEVRLVKKNFGWPEDKSFYVPKEVLGRFRRAREKGERLEAEWNSFFERYAKGYPEMAKSWEQMMKGSLPDVWKDPLPEFLPEDGPMGTRYASGKVLSSIAPKIFSLIGGSADLGTSIMTYIPSLGDFDKDRGGRNIHFGVREHAMGAIFNGLALNKLTPYGGTFLIFSDYMRPAIRMAAMMGLRVIYVFSHDSIGVGEDGPTHQPIEQLADLRSIPNLTVIRPADANETVYAWKVALENRTGPTALILTRQRLPIIDRRRYADAGGLKRGGYIVADPEEGSPELIIIGTGSELYLAIDAHEGLKTEGIRSRVVSLPSWEIFKGQTKKYRDHVLPPDIKARLAIEAGSPMGWRDFVGLEGEIISMESFGHSAPQDVLFEKFGFSVKNLVMKTKGLLDK